MELGTRDKHLEQFKGSNYEMASAADVYQATSQLQDLNQSWNRLKDSEGEKLRGTSEEPMEFDEDDDISFIDDPVPFMLQENRRFSAEFHQRIYSRTKRTIP